MVFSLFDRTLSLPSEDIEIDLRSLSYIPWSDFLLNPRRLRGSDFLMRWSQGVWSEDSLVQAVNQTGKYYALPYGPSGTAPDDIREFELYFERLELAGLGKLKRPDLLIYSQSDEQHIKGLVERIGGLRELPFTSEENTNMRELLSRAIIAVECETSLWRAKQMPDFGANLKPQRRLEGQLGLKKSAVLPTVIIKEQDRHPLLDWQNQNRIKIHIWHVFFDLAFGIALDTIEELIADGRIKPTEQVFQAPGGATTRKAIFKVYYHYAYPLADSRQEPSLIADQITDRNGHILPYVRFEGGSFVISPEAIKVLSEAVEGVPLENSERADAKNPNSGK